MFNIVILGITVLHSCRFAAEFCTAFITNPVITIGCIMAETMASAALSLSSFRHGKQVLQPKRGNKFNGPLTS